MKKIAKSVVVKTLSGYVKKLRKDNDFTIVAVVGSIGKTSTKFAVAQVLGEKFRVRFQQGNYNDIVTVPLIFFDIPQPALTNPLAWAGAFAKIRKQLKQPYPYDVVVVELGTDGPGQIKAFADYLDVDIAVVSAITPEHMEFFTDINAVAKEELSVVQYSTQVIANSDLVDGKHLSGIEKKLSTFGTDKNAEYQIQDVQFSAQQGRFTIKRDGGQHIKVSMPAVSMAEVYSASAAAAVSLKLGLQPKEIEEGIAKLQPVSGRMQRLMGINDSLIIDETYNASPVAMKAALDSLYEMDGKQKIAILGNMNELGGMSEAAHVDVGSYCEPSQLDLVVTIGSDANRFLAPAASANGCRTAVFTDPYSAGEFIKGQLKPGAVILAKGSQNGVFAEEAIKLLLARPEESEKLVRQSAAWLSKKEKQFGKSS